MAQRSKVSRAQQSCTTGCTLDTIDDLAKHRRTSWEGVRNFQARNFMRDQMQLGDSVLFYASNADPSGVTGIAEVSRTSHPGF